MNLMPSGRFGVDLFFVLSGFLITSILLNERKRSEREQGNRSTIIKGFFTKRVLRIFPIYYLAILVLYLVHYPYLREHLVYYLLYLGNILPYKTNVVNPLIHMWSLGVEEQFYLLWPWPILLLKEKYLKYVFAAAILAGIISKYVVLFVFHHQFAVLVINCFDAFGIGGLYAYVRQDKQLCVKFEEKFRIIFVAMVFLALLMIPIKGLPILVVYYRVMDSVVALAMIMFVLNSRYAWLNRHILENRFLNFAGKISYGLYLYHYVLGSYLDEFLHKVIFRTTILSAGSYMFAWAFKVIFLFMLSWLSFEAIERPFLRLKRYVKYRPDNKETTVPDTAIFAKGMRL